MSARAQHRIDHEQSSLDNAGRSRLREAFLHELSHAERLLLLLRYAESMTVEEVALVMNISHDEVVATQERLVSRLGLRLRAA